MLTGLESQLEFFATVEGRGVMSAYGRRRPTARRFYLERPRPTPWAAVREREWAGGTRGWRVGGALNTLPALVLDTHHEAHRDTPYKAYPPPPDGHRSPGPLEWGRIVGAPRMLGVQTGMA
jgi:hypothetical protein